MELKDEILEKIIERTAQVFKKEPADLSGDTRFKEDLNAKSVNVVQIITTLEADYDVQVNYMKLRRKETLGEAAEFVAELIEG